MKVNSVVFLSRAGCFLPLLILFNLFFGWIFLKPLHWLMLGAALILLFITSGYIGMRKILRDSSQKPGDAIDVKGEVLDEHAQMPPPKHG